MRLVISSKGSCRSGQPVSMAREAGGAQLQKPIQLPKAQRTRVLSSTMILVGGLCVSALLGACNKDGPKPAPETRALEPAGQGREGHADVQAREAAPAAAAPAAAGPTTPAGTAAPSTISETNFDLSLAAKDGCSVGKPAQ
ncbi:MAG TPA: hypothetical protein VFQ61_11345, partial [Polyangiaceae bacterium]|nr:hypothetical protein [Polyangiaceae bacterium]